MKKIPRKSRAVSFHERKPKKGPRDHRQQLTHLRKLVDAAEIVNSSLDVDTLLGLILKTATETTEADRGTVYLVDESSNDLWSKVLQGKELLEIRLPKGKGIAGYVARTGKTVSISNAYADPRFNPEIDRLTGYRTKSMLCMPMKNRNGSIIGVFQLLNKRKGLFLREDEEFIEGLSVHASLAIENARLAQSMVQSERLSAVGRMASSIIHDIKNPLGVLRLSAQIIEQKSGNRETAQLAHEMVQQIDRFVAMAQEVLDFSRGVSQLEIKEVSVPETLRSILSFSKRDLARRKITLDLQVDYKGSICLDQEKIARAIHNIIGNARDAMPKGGTITVQASKRKSELMITVRDTGIGIPKAIQAKVFEPFVTHGKKHGTGLGMAIVKKIIDDHQGSISIESEEGKGTTVTILMPLRRSDLPARAVI